MYRAELLARTMRKVDLGVNLAGLKLKNPIVLCSGTAGGGVELKDFIDTKKLGAVITKTVTLKPRQGNPPPRIAECCSGVLNSIGLENAGLKYFLLQLDQLKKTGTQIIVSIYADTQGDFQKMLERLNELSYIKALELNLSCPNIKTKKIISQYPKDTYELITFLRNKTKKMLVAKLTPQVSDIVAVAKAAKDAGIDAVSLVNTFPGIKIDLETRKPFLGNISGGLSGPAIKPLALYSVFKVYEKLKIPIIASGGVMDYKDVLEFILSGATCVGIGTATLIDPDASGTIIKDLTDYMKKSNLRSIKTLCGRAHAK